MNLFYFFKNQPNDFSQFLFNHQTAILIKTENDKSMEAVDEAYEIYGCEYCDQEFTNTTDLLEHRETHAEVQATNYIDDSS